MKRIHVLLPLINIVGAVFTYLYFSLILRSDRFSENLPAYFSPLFLAVGTALLVLVVTLKNRKRKNALFDVAYGRIDIHALDDPEIDRLQRDALRFPIKAASVTLSVWVLAGFVFGFLQPLIAGKMFNIEIPSLIYCFKKFSVISILGGGITTLVVFFALENGWRNHIPKFFPEGRLSRVKDGFRLNVPKRFLIVFLSIVLIPFPVLGVTIYSNITALHTADALTRAQIMSDLVVELMFILADSMTVCFILAFFLSRSISVPLLHLKDAIKKVQRDNLDARVEIVSNDELGEVAEGFNRMIASIRESQSIRETFGKFVSQEIRDEILSGKTTLDGEMKRVTLLFSDLRDFTPLVEQNHPQHVVKIIEG